MVAPVLGIVGGMTFVIVETIRRIRWPWQRWRRYDLSVDGHRFRVWVNPIHCNVEWLDCPGEFVPSGYSSTVFVGGASCRVCARWQAWRLMPIPTAEQMQEEIRDWLANLDDLEDE
ncbi:hypothetical protein HMPREF1531_00771 [Propionibacterium sp. oral taxon 192 str. F0372]|nr:hypothetical protein HMPREF1531_00771 [Propionibacterium sp. oral taxon 192 str. F0372]